jgi:hypothetical protein
MRQDFFWDLYKDVKSLDNREKKGKSVYLILDSLDGWLNNYLALMSL